MSNFIHGESYTRLHVIWDAMKARCKGTVSDRVSANYADKDIEVCKEWADSYTEFRDWALSTGYRDDLTLDRRNANLGYNPDNCRWATHQQQQWNKRKSEYTLSKYKGVSLNPNTLKWQARISKNGRRFSLGCFSNEDEAAIAYNEAAIELFGDFASLNEIL